jgi:hypothetical protein
MFNTVYQKDAKTPDLTFSHNVHEDFKKHFE